MKINIYLFEFKWDSDFTNTNVKFSFFHYFLLVLHSEAVLIFFNKAGVSSTDKMDKNNADNVKYCTHRQKKAWLARNSHGVQVFSKKRKS